MLIIYGDWDSSEGNVKLAGNLQEKQNKKLKLKLK